MFFYDDEYAIFCFLVLSLSLVEELLAVYIKTNFGVFNQNATVEKR